MKNLILSIFIAALHLMFSSCKQNDSSVNEHTSADVSGTMELWAEQIESTANTKKPEGWSDADWNSVTKNVDYKKIFNTITESVLDGKQRAYNYISDSVYTLDEIKSMITRSDTIYVEDPKTGKFKETVTMVSLKAEDISVIRVREKWNFDKEKFKLEKQATAMALFVNSYADDGSVRGYSPLFYVKLNN